MADTNNRIPAPLSRGHLCAACHGTGADIARTQARPRWESGHVMCSACNGNGLDPAEYFDWSVKGGARS